MGIFTVLLYIFELDSMFYFVISMQKNNTSRKMHGAEKL
mgnify:CR=1 FL=1